MKQTISELKVLVTLVVILFLINLGQDSLAQTLVSPEFHQKFINALPIPLQIDATKGGTFDMEMNQTTQWLGLVDNLGNHLMTTVWGYGLLSQGITYPGPTFVTKMNVPINVNWYNNLPATGHILPVDASIHLAHPEGIMGKENVAQWYADGNVPTVAHLHGGHTESASDGLPEAWFTQGVANKGIDFVKTNYTYDNDQEAATIWYHDHALGITRLNVYAGLAGFYKIEDNNERKLTVNGVLPKNKQDVEIVIQDRSFDPSGQLTLPHLPSDVGPMFEFEEDVWNAWPNPTIAAEFFGDYILVNGVTWPFLSVEPRPYRFRLLNGSDSRFYVLEFGSPKINFLQIGTDDGLLPNAVQLNRLVLAPGERAEIVVDFTGYETQNITLFNYGPDEPFKGFNTDGTLSDGEGGTLLPANPSSTGKIMQFKVNQRLKVTRGLPKATVSTGTVLRPPLTNLTSTMTRKLGLFEGMDENGRLQPLLGAIAEIGGPIESLSWDDPITENPALNAVETWEVYNFTADAHPVHLHLVSFQIINREPIIDYAIAEKNQLQHNGLPGSGAEASDIVLSGSVELPAENERGWKDTFIVPPGYVGRVKAKFDRQGYYVWHCHILSHEDHEMMRPYYVGTLQKQSFGNEVITLSNYNLEQNYPNPFNPNTTINFSIPEDAFVSLKVFNSLGQEVGTLINQQIPEGKHRVEFNALNLPSGMYLYTLSTGSFNETKKMILLK